MRLAVPNVWNSAKEMGPQKLFMLSVVTLGHVIVHWYQQLFSIIIPYVKADLGLTAVQVGTLSTARQITNGLTLPSGYLADAYRKQTHWILAAAIVSFGLGYFFIGLAPSYAWALAAAAVIGVGSALWHPAAIGSLSVRFQERRGMALSVHGAGASVGDSVAPIIVGAILLGLSWRTLMQYHLLPAVLVALVLAWTLRGVYKDSGPKPAFRSYLAGLRDMFKKAQVLGVMGSNTVSTMARLAVSTFLPIYISETLGYSSIVLGVYLALLYVMGLISQPVMGALSDKYGRKSVLVISFGVLGACFALMVMVPGGIALGVIIAVAGCFFYGTMNITQAAVMDVVGENVQASSMGAMGLVSQPFTLASPIITGFFIEAYGVSAAFWYAAILQGVATLMLVPIRFKRVR